MKQLTGAVRWTKPRYAACVRRQHAASASWLQGEVTPPDQCDCTALGPVNLAALDELARRATERKVFLDSQMADLTEAINDP